MRSPCPVWPHMTRQLTCGVGQGKVAGKHVGPGALSKDGNKVCKLGLDQKSCELHRTHARKMARGGAACLQAASDSQQTTVVAGEDAKAVRWRGARGRRNGVAEHGQGCACLVQRAAL